MDSLVCLLHTPARVHAPYQRSGQPTHSTPHARKHPMTTIPTAPATLALAPTMAKALGVDSVTILADARPDKASGSLHGNFRHLTRANALRAILPMIRASLPDLYASAKGGDPRACATILSAIPGLWRVYNPAGIVERMASLHAAGLPLAWESVPAVPSIIASMEAAEAAAQAKADKAAAKAAAAATPAPVEPTPETAAPAAPAAETADKPKGKRKAGKGKAKA